MPASVEQINDSGASQSWSVDVLPDSIVYAYVYDDQGTGASVYLTIDDGLSFSENWRFEHAVLEVGGESVEHI